MVLDERWKEHIKKKGIPFCSQLYVTYRRNLRCRHCYRFYVEGRREPSAANLRERLDKLARQGGLFIVVTGGEPLMRKDFFDIVNYAQSKSFALILETNGTLITPHIADRIAGSGFWEVIVTLLGSTPSTHDTMTQIGGSFEKSTSAIRMLKTRGARVKIQSATSRENGEERRKMKILANKLGVNMNVYRITTPSEIMQIRKGILKNASR